MKKAVILVGLLALNLSLFAQADEQTDSLKNIHLEEVVVSSTRAGKNTWVPSTRLLTKRS